jgi:alpha-glucosidase
MIPMQSPIQNTSEKPSDTLMVHLYYTAEPSDIEWEYYEDDGETYQYQDGKYYLRKMIYKPGINEVEFRKKSGDIDSKFKYIRLVFHGFAPTNIIKFDGKPRKIYPVKVNFRTAAEKPVSGDPHTITCPSVIFPNSDERMIISW